MTRFMIFSPGRCGSTSLAEIVNIVRPNTCYLEPFNPDISGTHFINAALSRGLEQALADIWTTTTCLGIKHVCHPNGHPFPRGTKYNEELLTLPQGRVIVLYRQNILRRIISQEIAQQVKSWSVTDYAQDSARANHPFANIDARRVGWLIATDRDFLKWTRRLLNRTGQSSKFVAYEDLFSGSSEANTRIQHLNSILKFLELPQLAAQGDIPDAITNILFERAEYTSSSLYRKIPNIDEIEKRFGSEQTGYIFREGFAAARSATGPSNNLSDCS